MSAKTLHEIEASIDQLDWRDQVRLLEYLAPRIAKAADLASPSVEAPAHTAAWRRYREVGGQLAATSTPDAPGLTEAVSQMRR